VKRLSGEVAFIPLFSAVALKRARATDTVVIRRYHRIPIAGFTLRLGIAAYCYRHVATGCVPRRATSNQWFPVATEENHE
jgi:hypothetical protein